MIILASASPRRRELLEQIGVEFKVSVSDIEEIVSAENPSDLVLKNAVAKAKKVAETNRDFWVLGADTVVVLNNEIYGKPKDEADAFDMLKKFAGVTHEVLSGIAFVKNDKIFSEVVKTEVTFGNMTDSEIREYIATKEPMDKAGAYAVQGTAAKFIKSINGSYSNVVGLPLYEVSEFLKEINF